MGRLGSLVVVLMLAACSSSGPASTTAPTGTSAPPESPAASESAKPLTKVRAGLGWVFQGQFAGFMVAQSMGFYKDVGLDVQLIPGGPDVNGQALVVSGSAEFGMAGDFAQVMSAREQGIPVKGIFTVQEHQGGILICKKTTGITSWKDLTGKKIGVWEGSGRTGVRYALNVAGVGADNVTLLPQKFSMVEFYEDLFDCASATTPNELHVVLDAGYAVSDLTLLDFDQLGFRIPGDTVFTTDKLISDHPDVVQAFVTGTLKGWMYAIQHPEEAATIVLQFAPDLEYRKQVLQIWEMARLMVSGSGATKGIGYLDQADLETLLKAALSAGTMSTSVDVTQSYTNEFWDNVPSEDKVVPDVPGLLQRVAENTGNPLANPAP